MLFAQSIDFQRLSDISATKNHFRTLTSSFLDIICCRICSISRFSRMIVVQRSQLSVIRCCRKLKSVKICSTHLRVVCFSRVSSTTYYINRHLSINASIVMKAHNLENKCAFRCVVSELNQSTTKKQQTTKTYGFTRANARLHTH